MAERSAASLMVPLMIWADNIWLINKNRHPNKCVLMDKSYLYRTKNYHNCRECSIFILIPNSYQYFSSSSNTLCRWLPQTMTSVRQQTTLHQTTECFLSGIGIHSVVGTEYIPEHIGRITVRLEGSGVYLSTPSGFHILRKKFFFLDKRLYFCTRVQYAKY